jgi:hypothetical protein
MARLVCDPFRVRFNLVESRGSPADAGSPLAEFCCRIATTVHACLQFPAFPRDLSAEAWAKVDLGDHGVSVAGAVGLLIGSRRSRVLGDLSAVAFAK